MKKLVLFTTLTLFTLTLFAQKGTNFGIKGGLNYNGNGDYFESIEAAAEDPDKNLGFHIGVFGQLGKVFYVRPELVYTNTKSGYDDGDFKMQKLDLPVLAGFKIIGPLSIFAGPSFQYILDTKFDGNDLKNVENDFSVGLNFGVGVSFRTIGIDLRYERGFNENEATFLNDNGVDISRLDTRPEQLILSLSVAL